MYLGQASPSPLLFDSIKSTIVARPREHAVSSAVPRLPPISSTGAPLASRTRTMGSSPTSAERYKGLVSRISPEISKKQHSKSR